MAMGDAAGGGAAAGAEHASGAGKKKRRRALPETEPETDARGVALHAMVAERQSDGAGLQPPETQAAAQQAGTQHERKKRKKLKGV